MNCDSSVERAKLILKTPNPLFETFLEEFIAEARAKACQSRLEHYEKALTSLKKYPLKLRSGKDCIILEHFDARLCVKLDMKLRQHNSPPLVERQINEPASVEALNDLRPGIHETLSQPVAKTKGNKKTGGSQRAPKKTAAAEENQVNKGNKTKEYLPTYRSAAYAILISLFNNEKTDNYKGYMTKNELQTDAQNYCDTSMKKPRAGTFYSGWSSVSLLSSKGLVSKKSSPAKFSLTDAGRELANRLIKGTGVSQNSVDPEPSLQPSSHIVSPRRFVEEMKIPNEEEYSQTTSSSSQFETEDMVFLPNTFEVILLVDYAETVGGPRKDDQTISELTSLSVKFDVRRLNVGDFVWIARDSLGREIVLPYIVERKRLDDLAKSIKDGRFDEQKFRLTKSGMGSVIYLFEETGSYENLGLPYETLAKAMVSTMLPDNILIKITDGHLQSMRFLANVTKILESLFKKKTLISGLSDAVEENLDDDTVILQSFAKFFDNMGKNRDFTAEEMFVKLLIQLNGVSAEKAVAIAKRFGTPKGLMDHFVEARDGGQSIALLEYGEMKRKIGPTLGTILYKFYTADSFD